MIAQGCHASLKVILDLMKDQKFANIPYINKTLAILNNSPLDKWINGLFTKICVYVNSEEELLNIYNKAKEEGIFCSLIQDAGITEFKGVPTYTCCAIGPDYSENIDKVTGHLPLL